MGQVASEYTKHRSGEQDTPPALEDGVEVSEYVQLRFHGAVQLRTCLFSLHSYQPRLSFLSTKNAVKLKERRKSDSAVCSRSSVRILRRSTRSRRRRAFTSSAHALAKSSTFATNINSSRRLTGIVSRLPCVLFACKEHCRVVTAEISILDLITQDEYAALRKVFDASKTGREQVGISFG